MSVAMKQPENAALSGERLAASFGLALAEATGARFVGSLGSDVDDGQEDCGTSGRVYVTYVRKTDLFIAASPDAPLPVDDSDLFRAFPTALTTWTWFAVLGRPEIGAFMHRHLERHVATRQRTQSEGEALARALAALLEAQTGAWVAGSAGFVTQPHAHQVAAEMGLDLGRIRVRFSAFGPSVLVETKNLVETPPALRRFEDPPPGAPRFIADLSMDSDRWVAVPLEEVRDVLRCPDAPGAGGE